MKKIIKLNIKMVVAVPDEVEVQDVNSWVLDHCFVGNPRSVIDVKVEDSELVDDAVNIITIIPQRGTPKAMDIPEDIESQEEDDDFIMTLL